MAYGIPRWLGESFGGLSLKGKLMVTLIPSVVVILGITGYINYTLSDSFIGVATERNVRVRTMAIANDVQTLLGRCASDLLMATEVPRTQEAMQAHLRLLQIAGGPKYVEFAFISASGDDHVFLVRRGEDVVAVPSSQVHNIRPSPLLSLEKPGRLMEGEVVPGQLVEVEYPVSLPGLDGQHYGAHVIRFTIRVPGDKGMPAGFLVLGLDAHALRDILSLHNSPRSPLYAYPRSSEVRFSYLVDADGWILFQSEDTEHGELPLSSHLARAGYEGTLGRPGLHGAFRPNGDYGHYWKMADAIGEGRGGLDVIPDKGPHAGELPLYYFSYAPVFFTPKPGAQPTPYAGVVFVDRSKLIMAAGYKHLDVMFIITLSTTVVITIIIYILSMIISAPINRLARAVDSMQQSGRLEPVDLPTTGYETRSLQTAVNNLILRIKQQLEVIRLKDETILNVNLKERADLEMEIRRVPRPDWDPIPEILGLGPKTDLLKADIVKAAQVDVDVLILGETGTGKQLTAEAIHRHGHRTGQPFISLNCGALDENLLLDALFGHTKGAFTEAKTDRKGAFLEAHGGTLFLDEIQSASPKVQQALLRALSIRKIKPLGSDREVDVDVRVIAATNADLGELIERGAFREDLYFRLKVLTLHTPPLREHKESLPLLARFYLKQAEQITGRRGVGLSRGALEKLRGYDWPGNIREFVNSLTRAVVMAEADVIQASDLKLENETLRSADVPVAVLAVSPSAGPVSGPASGPASGQEPGAASADKTPAAASASRAGRPPVPPAPQPVSDEESRAAPPRPVPNPSSVAEAPAGGAGGAAGSSPARLPDEALPTPRATSQGKPESNGADAGDETAGELNPRQQRGHAFLLKKGEMSRSEYEALFPEGISARSALYDLQDLVKRGLIRKTGKGPATRYVLSRK